MKWVFKNVQTTSTQTSADAWWGFFSDPACTVPVDITAYGMIINAKIVFTTNGDDTVKTYNKIGTGTEMFIDNTFISITNPPFVIMTTEFTILAGTGYTPVNP